MLYKDKTFMLAHALISKKTRSKGKKEFTILDLRFRISYFGCMAWRRCNRKGDLVLEFKEQVAN